MKDRVLLYVILGVVAASLVINVKFALAALEAQGAAENFKKDPIGALKALFLPAKK